MGSTTLRGQSEIRQSAAVPRTVQGPEGRHTSRQIAYNAEAVSVAKVKKKWREYFILFAVIVLLKR